MLSHVDVCSLLDPATFYFVTSYLHMRFNILLDVFLDHFYVPTSLDDSIIDNNVYRKCPSFCPIETL